jgi:hypothetical protein
MAVHLAYLALTLLAIAIVADAQTACSSVGQCPLAQPVCQQFTQSFFACAACPPDYARMGGGGSCYCDASQAYCSSAQTTLATCRLATIINAPCTVDGDCVTHASNTLHANAVDQSMYCIGGKCKPCNPATWSKYQIGGPSLRYTCPGYDPVLSNQYNRYMTGSPMPGFTFTCTSAGDILVLNSTIDFNYGYPGGDRSKWTPTSAVVATTATTATASTAATATTGAAASGSGSVSSTTGASATAATTTASTTGGKTKANKTQSGSSGATAFSLGAMATGAALAGLLLN